MWVMLQERLVRSHRGWMSGISFLGKTDEASWMSCNPPKTLECQFGFVSCLVWSLTSRMIDMNLQRRYIRSYEHTQTSAGKLFDSFLLFPAWEPAVLQSPRWIQDHDQWLWLVKDGGNRWRYGHRLWDSRIRGWGCPLSSCFGGNLLWDN